MAAIRALLARFLPQGAILLSILTFTAYGMGLVRDRLFARTYGAGAELDAYNAAFVLPELALDVLVASGLTAPFVPVFTSLARKTADAAPRFAQTVLTLAVMVMSASSLLLLILAPATVRLVAPGFDESNQALYLDLYRVMLLTPILFGASITLGEVLVAERQFLYYALAPILYNLGIVARHPAAPRQAGDHGSRRRGGHRRLPAPGHPRRRHAAHDRAGSERAWTCGCPPCASSSG